MKAIALKLIDALGLYPLFHRHAANTAAVLMLHEIIEQRSGSGNRLTRDMLASFLGYLNHKDYNVVSARRFVDMLTNGNSCRKSVVFTIDDGYRDFYLNAYPLFVEYKFPATMFITTDFIDGQLFFWWDQLEYIVENVKSPVIDLEFMDSEPCSIANSTERRGVVERLVEHCKRLPSSSRHETIAALAKSLKVTIPDLPPAKYAPLRWEEITEMQKKGIEFLPHTCSHPIMTQISLEEKTRELTRSKEILEERLQLPADIFCYPNGRPEDIDDETVKALKKSGYRAAFTAIPGFNYANQENDLFRLHRLAIPFDRLRFNKYVSGFEAAQFKMGR